MELERLFDIPTLMEKLGVKSVGEAHRFSTGDAYAERHGTDANYIKMSLTASEPSNNRPGSGIGIHPPRAR